MVEFKIVISDPNTGKSYQTNLTGHYANSLIGKRIGEEVDGIFVNLPGYKLILTGGTDKDGFPMRSDISGTRKVKILLSSPPGFHSYHNGLRKKKIVIGNTISVNTMQINMKITSHGAKKIDEIFKKSDEGEKNK